MSCARGRSAPEGAEGALHPPEVSGQLLAAASYDAVERADGPSPAAREREQHDRVPRATEGGEHAIGGRGRGHPPQHLFDAQVVHRPVDRGPRQTRCYGCP